MTEVEIYLNVDTEHRFTETEDADREFALWYYSDKTGEAAAEEAFHISNAPDELLTDKQKHIRQRWKGRSLSVGDIVSVADADDLNIVEKRYLCCSCGWKEIKR
jgi:hypothetical protein